MSLLTFVSFGQAFFVSRYGLAPEKAGFAAGLVFLVAAFAIPFTATLIDRFGKNISFLTAAVVGNLAAHTLLAFASGSVPFYIPVVAMGICFSVFTSIWTVIAMIVPEESRGTAYGKSSSFQFNAN